MKSPFQTILLVIFGIVAVIAVLIFAGYLPSGIGPFGSKPVEEVTIWGPYDKPELTQFFNELNDKNKQLVQIKYQSQVPENYLDHLIEAFARGEGPDLFFADQKMLDRLSGKISEIPYSVYPQRDILNNFADGVSVFMNSKGLKSMPLFIDPLVMYYNRTMYASANIVVPPKNWTEFMTTIKPIVEIDARNNITRTATALGEFRNITNAKYIFSTLLLQAGNPIIVTNIDDTYQPVLSNDYGLTPPPTEASLNFYQQFSNPTQLAYSWNRSLTNDKDMFVAENLATYFGFASELSDLQAKNPHLSLDAVLIPQKDPQKRVTYGNFYGLTISKNSKKQSSSILAADLLSQSVNLNNLSGILKYLPSRRDLLVAKDPDPFIQVFKDSAVVARSWVDPDSNKTNEIFTQLSEGVKTGQVKITDAVKSADANMLRLFRVF